MPVGLFSFRGKIKSHKASYRGAENKRNDSWTWVSFCQVKTKKNICVLWPEDTIYMCKKDQNAFSFFFLTLSLYVLKG